VTIKDIFTASVLKICSINLQDILQWRLVTVMRGDAVTAPNKDFVKTEKHQVFHNGAVCYNL